LYVFDENGNLVDNEDEYWLIEVDRKIRSIVVDGKHLTPKTYRVSYSPYAIAPQKIVFAIPFHKSKFIFLRSFYNKWFYYGYSFVMSILDDIDAMYNIIQNIINITKHKAIGKTLITVGDDKNPASPEDIENIKNALQSGTFDNIILNKPIKIDHLSYEGDYNTLTGELDWLRREVQGGLTPNYLTAWNSEVNRATSQEVKLVLDTQLKIWRRSILHFLNNTIMKSLKEYFNIKNDVWFEFKEFDLYTPDEKLNIYDRMYNDNIISLNEFRKAMGLDPIENGDIFRAEYDYLLRQKYEGSSTYALSYQSTGNEFKEQVQILKQREVNGHVVKLKEEGSIYLVYDGKELLLKTDDKQTAETYYNNYIQKIRNHELSFPSYEYKEEEEEIIKQMKNELVNIKKEVDNLLSKHSESFKEAKIINMKVINPLHKMLDKFFNKIGNTFTKTISKIFNKSKQDVINYIKRIKGDKEANKLLKVDMKKLKLDAYTKLFNQDLQNLQDKKKTDLARQVMDSYIAGVPSTKIKQQILQAVDDIHHEADRIVRTNTNRMAILSKLLMFKQMGIKKYVWIATLDDRTRETHRKRHGKVYSVDRALKGLDPAPTMVRDKDGRWMPGENVNCRCTIRPYYD